MSLNINTVRQSGFTIVELLIVVVVIAILAAITIVSYNGITSQANTAASQSTASTIIKKAELYANAEGTSGYPTSLSALTSASSSDSHALPAGSAIPAANLAGITSSKHVIIQTCGTAAGVQVWYKDFGTGELVDEPLRTGDTSGCTSATVPTPWSS